MKTGTRREATGNSKSARLFGFALCAVLCALCVSAQAHHPTKIPRIGYLFGSSLSANKTRIEAFQRGLRDLGYVEGKNILVEWRGADGNRDRQRALVAELVGLKADIIVTAGSSGTRFAKAATSTIPIIMAQDADPVSSGFVASLARPGGNITGLSTLSPELSGKKLELLKEIIPKLSRVAVFGTSTNPGNAEALKEIELAAGVLGMKLQYVDILSPTDIESAFQTVNKGHADAVLMNVAGPLYTFQRPQIAELAAKSRLPVIYETAQSVEAGGLMSYGVNLNDLARRAPTYVDKILKGAKPADLPVEQPTKFEFVFNLKAAERIGLTIPPNVLARADRVIR
jgi:ABC-type uncharacterized transport system substrate-binding protein